jgi:hypothetical protein
LFLVFDGPDHRGAAHGHEIKGSRRWILASSLRFLKPAFVVLVAWALSEAGKRRDVPANFLAVLLLLVTAVPLILQPDFGQTMLVALVWAALFVVAGLPWFWVAGIGGAGFCGALLAYKLVPHVRARVLKFIDPGAGGGIADTFQVDTALDSFLSGGWFGKGPGEGTIKRILPDAHTDFIFAVTGEEFGVLACLLIAAIFAFIVLRGLFMAARNEDPFCRFAAAGLVMLFASSAINMAVNVHLIRPRHDSFISAADRLFRWGSRSAVIAVSAAAGRVRRSAGQSAFPSGGCPLWSRRAAPAAICFQRRPCACRAVRSHQPPTNGRRNSGDFPHAIHVAAVPPAHPFSCATAFSANPELLRRQLVKRSACARLAGGYPTVPRAGRDARANLARRERRDRPRQRFLPRSQRDRPRFPRLAASRTPARRIRPATRFVRW